MRLIDVDALKKIWEDDECSLHDYTHLHFIESIDEQPTIDAEPVRHGKWLISEYEYFDCSICGGYYPNGCDSHEEAERKLKNHDTYARCPHCGAKMGNGGGSA